MLGWAMVATALLLMDGVGAASLRDLAQREQALYETWLDEVSTARDIHAEEVRAARDRFNVAMAEVSRMQSELLASEERRRELETGIELLQGTLRKTIAERDAARGRAEVLAAKLDDATPRPVEGGPNADDLQATLAFLSDALEHSAAERELVEADASAAYQLAEALAFERELTQERNDRIFTSLEEALTVSVAPLDTMFRSAGLSVDTLIDQVRAGYNGTGGPLTPVSFSSKGDATPTAEELRAESLLARMDEINLYRIAAEKLPFAQPLRSAYRFTSPFGMRKHPILGTYKMHDGMDMAAGYGTPIHATADGVVVKAGWVSGYGRLIKIRHEFGIETRYAHLAKIRVTEGQRVSRGDRIGDMGNSGRSTGTHLHYEVRVDGKPVNPMTYIKAARNVF
ncbi:murein DD-endopeptidase MepM/ murein hydrolase activator NlpD [Rhodovulum adriaticum]|uniref:Murein DD-endopeptidase MepM/ murein hydrolase activator NlpD n=2 Tax=Rhodovulum adriaticum TaxID=35804 RepID=A0A4R2NP26_RHOAD|nr:murein DD-endopeptidase MepM/ murein hydrolase activator NlpD [Rhodovulum adriaticum]